MFTLYETFYIGTVMRDDIVITNINQVGTLSALKYFREAVYSYKESGRFLTIISVNGNSIYILVCIYIYIYVIFI